nr:peptidase [Monilinia fructicola barnavirus 1]
MNSFCVAMRRFLLVGILTTSLVPLALSLSVFLGFVDGYDVTNLWSSVGLSQWDVQGLVVSLFASVCGIIISVCRTHEELVVLSVLLSVTALVLYIGAKLIIASFRYFLSWWSVKIVADDYVTRTFPSGTYEDYLIEDGKMYLLVKSDMNTTFKVRAPMFVAASMMQAGRGRVQMNESPITGSEMLRVGDLPRGQVYINTNGAVVGGGFFTMYNGKSCLVTAAHVLDVAKLSGKPVALSYGGVNVQMKTGWKLQGYSKDGGFDFAIVAVPAAVVSALKSTHLKFAPMHIGIASVTYSNRQGEFYAARGQLTPLSSPFMMKHTISTLPSASGSPIMANGRVVAVHLGTLAGGTHNRAVALGAILKWKESRRSESDFRLATWQEDDDVDYKIQRRVDFFLDQMDMEMEMRDRFFVAHDLNPREFTSWDEEVQYQDEFRDDFYRNQWEDQGYDDFGRNESSDATKPVFQEGLATPSVAELELKLAHLQHQVAHREKAVSMLKSAMRSWKKNKNVRIAAEKKKEAEKEAQAKLEAQECRAFFQMQIAGAKQMSEWVGTTNHYATVENQKREARRAKVLKRFRSIVKRGLIHEQTLIARAAWEKQKARTAEILRQRAQEVKLAALEKKIAELTLVLDSSVTTGVGNQPKNAKKSQVTSVSSESVVVERGESPSQEKEWKTQPSRKRSRKSPVMSSLPPQLNESGIVSGSTPATTSKPVESSPKSKFPNVLTSSEGNFMRVNVNGFRRASRRRQIAFAVMLRNGVDPQRAWEGTAGTIIPSQEMRDAYQFYWNRPRAYEDWMSVVENVLRARELVSSAQNESSDPRVVSMHGGSACKFEGTIWWPYMKSYQGIPRPVADYFAKHVVEL